MYNYTVYKLKLGSSWIKIKTRMGSGLSLKNQHSNVYEKKIRR